MFLVAYIVRVRYVMTMKTCRWRDPRPGPSGPPSTLILVNQRAKTKRTSITHLRICTKSGTPTSLEFYP